MDISSVSSSSPVQTPRKMAPSESTEATNAGKDVKKDGDPDDAQRSLQLLRQSLTNQAHGKIYSRAC